MKRKITDRWPNRNSGYTVWLECGHSIWSYSGMKKFTRISCKACAEGDGSK